MADWAAVQQRLPSLLPRPILFAHRGARAYAPDNTLEVRGDLPPFENVVVGAEIAVQLVGCTGAADRRGEDLELVVGQRVGQPDHVAAVRVIWYSATAPPDTTVPVSSVAVPPASGTVQRSIEVTEVPCAR